jgi:hypothetical protein
VSITVNKVKQEVTDVLLLAVRDWLAADRGSKLAGNGATAVRVGPSVIQLKVRRADLGLGQYDYLEIRVMQRF